MNHRSEVMQQGYTVVRNALTSPEVQLLRLTIREYFTRYGGIYFHGGKARLDAFNEPSLQSILFLLEKNSILDPIKSIIGDSVCYCNHSDVFMNVCSSWHTDDLGVASDCHSSNGDAYGIYKVALYLQDHQSGHGALRVRRCSHINSRPTDDAIEDIRVKAGDAIIFDLRILHSGTDCLIHPWFERILHTGLRNDRVFFGTRRLMRMRNDRLAIFFVFGRANDLTRRHIEAIARQNQALGVEQSAPCPEVVSRLRSHGILV
jgi:hypothetical protein